MDSSSFRSAQDLVVIGPNRHVDRLGLYSVVSPAEAAERVCSLPNSSLYTDTQASTDFHGCWTEEVARQSEGRWIARAAVGILHEITIIEIKRGEQISPDPSLPFRSHIKARILFQDCFTKYLTEPVNIFGEVASFIGNKVSRLKTKKGGGIGYLLNICINSITT